MSASSESRAPDFVWSGECNVVPGGPRLVQLLRDRRLLVYDSVQVRTLFFITLSPDIIIMRAYTKMIYGKIRIQRPNDKLGGRKDISSPN